jgi:hypothetical protein
MELRLHGGYARTWGVELDELDHVDPACQAYTDFLMAAAEDPEVGRRAGGGLGAGLSAGGVAVGHGTMRRLPPAVLRAGRG